jgi:hypothetical protein
MEPLASFGNSQSVLNTNLSRTISLSILDLYGNEISIQTDINDRIELIIPRDPNLILPSMIFQNVTFSNNSYKVQSINIKENQPNKNQTISIHFEIHRLNKNLAYLLIYKFDQLFQLTNQMDNWTLLCPSS